MITESDESNVEYFLTNGLNHFILQVLEANDPSNQFFNLKVDTMINRNLNNLLNCGVSAAFLGQNFIDGGCQWVLNRFAPRMAHNDLEARIEASNLMFSLLRLFSHSAEDSHKKEFLIQNYELIRTAINVLKNESSERVTPILLDIIILSVTRHFNLDV